MSVFPEYRPLSCFCRGIFLNISAVLFITLFYLAQGPHGAEAAGLSGIYSGQGMILQLSGSRGDGEVEGALYRKNMSFRFRGNRKGDLAVMSSLYVRNDRRAPYRKTAGSLSIRVLNRGEKLRMEISASELTLSGLFRRYVSPRAYSLLSLYGDTYCDGRHLVLVLEDKAPPSEGGWLSRLLQKQDENLPVVGMYFGPDLWYYFQAKGGLESGLKKSEVISGGGVYGGYLGTATVNAGLKEGRLKYGFQDTTGSRSLLLPPPSQKSSCTRVVTKWTSKRRMQRGRRLAVPDAGKEQRGAGRPGKVSKEGKASPLPRKKAVLKPAKAPDIPDDSRVREKKAKDVKVRKAQEPEKNIAEEPLEQAEEYLPIEGEDLEQVPDDEAQFPDEAVLDEYQPEDLTEPYEEDLSVYDESDVSLEPYEVTGEEDLQAPDEVEKLSPEGEASEIPEEIE